ncbi:ATP-binding cassette domain-containing protein [Thermoplasma sp.]|uniref:ATP-binding cassette domain-containing protein n=1 Tax=Thermoplasma sp. TaxID=1973142 RepID=UPI00260F3187|nr:ATP-binding cassette domain-containing protein [Thermoplasma sp.]
MQNENIILDARHLNFSYPDFSLRDINISVHEGRIYGILGITGCGKTTLLNVLNAGLKHGNGELTWNGGYYIDVLNRRRPNFVYVPQSAADSLDTISNVIDQIGKVLKQRNMALDHDLLNQYLNMLGKDITMIKKKPQFLSQGERHLSVLLMAIMMHPSLIMMDEPTTSLDSVETLEFLDIVKRMAHDYHISFIISGTSPEVITYVSDFIYVMMCGMILEYSSTDDLARDPLHPYTEMILRRRPSLNTKNLTPFRFISECGDGGCPFLNYCPHVRDECRSPVDMFQYQSRSVRCVIWKR